MLDSFPGRQASVTGHTADRQLSVAPSPYHRTYVRYEKTGRIGLAPERVVTRIQPGRLASRLPTGTGRTVMSEAVARPTLRFRVQTLVSKPATDAMDELQVSRSSNRHIGVAVDVLRDGHGAKTDPALKRLSMPHERGARIRRGRRP